MINSRDDGLGYKIFPLLMQPEVFMVILLVLN